MGKISKIGLLKDKCEEKHPLYSPRIVIHGKKQNKHYQFYLCQVLSYSSAPVCIWNLRMLQVHHLLANVFIQKNSTIMRP